MDAEDTMLLAKRQILVKEGSSMLTAQILRMMLCSSLGADRSND